MNKQSNAYIIVYSVVLVVVVAVVLSFAALSLKSRQQANVEIEKMSDILGSVGLYKAEDAEKQPNKDAYIKDLYSKHIVESFLVNSDGQKIDSPNPASAAFKVLNNLKAELAKPAASRELPVFISKDGSGKINYIFPVSGVGLWGPIWGYIALNADLNTIDGVVFDHKSETPGLGAEITTPAFEDQFIGKTIYNNGKYVGIAVLKGAGSSKGNVHAVDAISGGTITSRSVQNMIIDNLSDYQKYIALQSKANQ